MWHFKAILTPVVVGALGMVKKKTENHIKRVQGIPCLQELQKIRNTEWNGSFSATCTMHVTKYVYCPYRIKRLTLS